MLPQIPNLVGPAVATKIITLREKTSGKLMPSIWLGSGAQYLSEPCRCFSWCGCHGTHRYYGESTTIGIHRGSCRNVGL